MSNQTIEISTSRSPRQNGGFIKIPKTRAKVSSREDIEPALENLREYLEKEFPPRPKFDEDDIVRLKTSFCELVVFVTDPMRDTGGRFKGVVIREDSHTYSHTYDVGDTDWFGEENFNWVGNLNF